LGALRERQLLKAGKALQDETGLAHRPFREGERVRGVNRLAIQFASGRHAMLDAGLGFSLVPWRPVTSERLGQFASAILRGSSVTWQLGRPRRSLVLSIEIHALRGCGRKQYLARYALIEACVGEVSDGQEGAD
jgi:hypothetical protein